MSGGSLLGKGRRWPLPWEAQGLAGRSVRLVTLPLSYLFRLGVWARGLCYRTRLLPTVKIKAPVISIGNIQVGGTGKTPFCRWIADQVGSRGLQVAIVTRGYGGSRRDPVAAGRKGRAEATVDEVGDEAIMLAKTSYALVVTGRDRVRAAEFAVNECGAQVVILDDGFQHRSLGRDLDIVLIDGTERNQHLLPAGPLREPLSALTRADLVLQTSRLVDLPGSSVPADGFAKGGDELVATTGLAGRQDWSGASIQALPLAASSGLHPRLTRVNLVPQSLVVSEQGRWRELPLAGLAGRSAVVVTGVANPAPLYRWLHEWELQVERVIERPDHYRYGVRDWQLMARAAEKVDLVVTTEKDLVKLEKFPFALGKLVAVRMGVLVEEEAALIDEVLGRVSSRRPGC